MKACLLALMLLFGLGLAHAADSAITYAGGDGSSMDKAVLIVGATDDMSATRAEYVYLKQHFPGYEMKMQSLVSRKKKSYDLLNFKDGAGKSRKIYFDITDTLGKF